jgi:hypothetical protein
MKNDSLTRWLSTIPVVLVFLMLGSSCSRLTAPMHSSSNGDQAEPTAYERSQRVQMDSGVGVDEPTALAGAEPEQATSVVPGQNRGASDLRPAVYKNKSRSIRTKVSRKEIRDSYAQAESSNTAPEGRRPGDLTHLRAFHPELFVPAPAAPVPPPANNFDLSDPLYLALFIILIILALVLLVLIITSVIGALAFIGVALLAALIIALVLLL